MSITRWPWRDYLNQEEIEDLIATECHLKWARAKADAAQMKRQRIQNLGTKRAQLAAEKERLKGVRRSG